jgi:hypothetical protein
MLRRRHGLPYGSSIAATFSALDPDGEISYVQARYLDPGRGPKYDNPAASLGTNPRVAWTRTPGGRTQQGILVVCEGIPDALTAAQHGYDAAGILGAQAPDHRVARHLATHAVRHHQRIIAVIDADPAGRTFGNRLAYLLADHGHNLHIVEPPDSLDLNRWAQIDATWTSKLLSREREPDTHHRTSPPAPRLDDLSVTRE